jgi:hypothetical protein
MGGQIYTWFLDLASYYEYWWPNRGAAAELLDPPSKGLFDLDGGTHSKPPSKSDAEARSALPSERVPISDRRHEESHPISVGSSVKRIECVSSERNAISSRLTRRNGFHCRYVVAALIDCCFKGALHIEGVWRAGMLEETAYVEIPSGSRSGILYRNTNGIAHSTFADRFLRRISEISAIYN